MKPTTFTRTLGLSLIAALALSACGEYDPELDGEEETPTATEGEPAASESEEGIGSQRYAVSASGRALVIMLENGGVGLPGSKLDNLTIPVWVCRSFKIPEMESATPWSIITSLVGAIPDALACLAPPAWVKKQLKVNDWLRAVTDARIEELARQEIINAGVLSGYAKVVFLEDADFTLAKLEATLKSLTPAYVIDLHVLTHGGEYFFGVDQTIWSSEVNALKPLVPGLRLRSVYQMNCYGSTVLWAWRSLGARAANGSVGINYMPFAYLTFLKNWLKGVQFDAAVSAGTIAATGWMMNLYQHLDLYDSYDNAYTIPKVSLGHKQSPNEEMSSSQMQFTGSNTAVTINTDI